MSRRPARFTESDLRRAIRAMKKEGVDVSVEMSPDGFVRLIPTQELKPVPLGLSPGLVL